MCGIAGVLRFAGSPRETSAIPIDRMTDTLAHRGPNDRGTWCDEFVALGHRRLSVIDLSSAGHQPMANEDGRVRITYNGELYNFRELAARFQLREKGHVFRSATDTEVLVHLYEELGVDMARHLNGMFALAIWDAAAKRLLLLRDPFGVKPLFIQRDATCVRFASEIKAILADPAVRAEPSLQALHDFLTFDYVPGAQSAFRGIEELPPGQWMTIDVHGDTKTGTFWEPSYLVDPAVREADAVRGARELMEQAVRRQLVADVPVGVMLSGGLDSSTLVAMMSHHASEPVHTYSVGFEDPSFNELPYARIVAEQYRTVAREVVVTPARVRELLPAYLRFIDEPYADGSAIPTYCVCEMAKDDVVVVLSGEGGDECFAGYETYSAFKASQWARRAPAWVRNGVVAPLIRRLPVSHKKLSLEFRLKRFLGGIDRDPARAHMWWRIVLNDAEKRALYSPRLREALADAAPPDRHFTTWFDRPGPPDDLARIMRIDASVFLPDDLMIKNDRMSMAHSLEARVPFTDPDLVDFLSRVPSSIKMPGLKKKNLMKQAVAGMLPPAIVGKKKVGLEMPYSRWFRHELRDVVESTLGAERIAATGLFDPAAVSALVARHMEGRVDHGRAIWGLLNYVMWMDLYLPGGRWNAA
ncbi:MAG TPA: asparagine synthase (glutamine-hydrolyzing) [Gemmatimonadaceae bacterium]|nr:asparagine synthase (glutamine-hydrolyzing) [Gemmatimonadaceae bacterium]